MSYEQRAILEQAPELLKFHLTNACFLAINVLSRAVNRNPGEPVANYQSGEGRKVTGGAIW